MTRDSCIWTRDLLSMIQGRLLQRSDNSMQRQIVKAPKPSAVTHAGAQLPSQPGDLPEEHLQRDPTGSGPGSVPSTCSRRMCRKNLPVHHNQRDRGITTSTNWSRVRQLRGNSSGTPDMLSAVQTVGVLGRDRTVLPDIDNPRLHAGSDGRGVPRRLMRTRSYGGSRNDLPRTASGPLSDRFSDPHREDLGPVGLP